MLPEAPRVGVVAGETLLAWQRDALDRVAASGARIVARIAAADMPCSMHAARACEAFRPVPWAPAPDAQHGAPLDAVIAFAVPCDRDALAGVAHVVEITLDGDPPGFATLERGARVVEVRSERVRAADGTRTVIARAVIAADATSYARTLRRIGRAAVPLAADALLRIRHGAEDGAPAPSPRASRPPTRARIARLAARGFVRRIAGALHDIVRSERWSVGVLETPLAALLDGARPQIAWLDLPRGRFWADPFPLQREDGVDVLCEGYDYRRDRGFLVRVALDAARSAGVPRMLDVAGGTHHCSYPCVVTDGDARYVVPEQYQARRVALYALEGDVLHERAVLLDGIAAVDPTPFRHDGRWWMFLTDQERDDNGELLLYHAPALTGPWTPHALNPIVRDVRCARPAGTPFVIDGTLYRPGQDCSAGYGSRVMLMRVDLLTPTTFRETPAGVVEPNGARGRAGIHTLGIGDSLVLVDGKDRVFDLAASAVTVRRYLGKLLARARRSEDLRPDSPRSGVSCAQSRSGATLPS